jgi:hypothetical protein
MRLYKYPESTESVLKAILGGATTQDTIAEELEVSKNSVHNYTHDPRILDIVQKQDGEYHVANEARRFIQLQDRDVLKEPFLNLYGVKQIKEQLDDEGELSFDQIGRTIAFETESTATDPKTFREYGRVYSNWFEYLDLGFCGQNSIATDQESLDTINRENPLQNPHGGSSPKVRPNKVLEAISQLDDANSKAELAEVLDYSDRSTTKILSTCYALQIAERDRQNGFRLTDLGNDLRTASQGERQKLIRDALLDIPLVCAFSNRVPDEEFTVMEVMARVSEDYDQGWSESTIKTKGKRLYQWLIYAELAEEVNRGTLKPTSILKNRKIEGP